MLATTLAGRGESSGLHTSGLLPTSPILVPKVASHMCGDSPIWPVSRPPPPESLMAPCLHAPRLLCAGEGLIYPDPTLN